MVYLVMLLLVAVIALVCSLNKANRKLKEELIKSYQETKKCVEEKEALTCKLQSILAGKRSSKKLYKEKSRRQRGVIKNKEEMLRVLEEQLAIAQDSDKGLRQANLRLANQVAEANDTIARMREEL